MNPTLASHHDARPSPRMLVLLALAASLGLALWLHGPIPQWASYHQFADQRAWLGLPNAADVLSNLPFALVGLGWLWATRRLPRSDASSSKEAGAPNRKLRSMKPLMRVGVVSVVMAVPDVLPRSCGRCPS